MEANILNFSQLYLSTILNLNTLLIAGIGGLLIASNNKCANVFFILAIGFAFISVVITVLSAKDILNFLVSQHSPSEKGFIAKFDILEWVFWADMASIIMVSVGLLIRYVLKEGL